MKSLVLCVILAAGIRANLIHFPPEQNDRVNNVARECIAETGVTFDVLSEISKGKVPDEERFKKFVFCFFKKVDIVTSDGQLNVDVAVSKMPPGLDRNVSGKLLESCKTKTGKDVVDTVNEMFKCYFYGTKVHIKLDFTYTPL